jgi:hypothetical protein
VSPSSEQSALLVRISAIYQSSRRLISKYFNVDLNDGFAVVFRDCTLVVSCKRRVIAIDELEKMLQWSWPIWGCYSATFLEELTVIMTNTCWNTTVQAKIVILYGTRLPTIAPLRVMLLVWKACNLHIIRPLSGVSQWWLVSPAIGKSNIPGLRRRTCCFNFLSPSCILRGQYLHISRSRSLSHSLQFITIATLLWRQ